MIDHGDLDEIETAIVVGEMVARMRDQLGFAAGSPTAATALEIDGEIYELTLRKKA